MFRLKSAAFTGGLGNPVVSTAELTGVMLTALVAVVLPLLCLLIVLVGIVLAFRASGRLMFGRDSGTPTLPAP
ncbi:MAG: DUF4126 family protein [Gemmatimonadales bacterium]